MSTTVDILCFISTCRTTDNELFKVKYAFNHETSIIYWNLNFTNNINFQSLEVVCRGSDTQLQVTENLDWTAPRSKGLTCVPSSFCDPLYLTPSLLITNIVVFNPFKHQYLQMFGLQLNKYE